MDSIKVKHLRMARRKRRVRKDVFGTADRPRLSVRRSLKHIYAQIIDDDLGRTLCYASTVDKELRGKVSGTGDKGAAAEVGKLLAERAKAQGIERVRFDRNGRKFHGRVKALAEAVREGGLAF
jgi:large subunit ribosomal protein L18